MENFTLPKIKEVTVIKVIKIKVFILVMSVLCLSSCTHDEPDKSQSVVSPSFTEEGDILKESESPDFSITPTDKVVSDKIIPTKEDILVAFRFWVNFEEWRYENDNYSSYIDEKRTVEIYYKRRDQKNYEGYLYFPFEKNGKTMYEEFSFLFGEEGFCSSPLTDCEPKKSINKKLTYLGTETFYFAKEDVCKPVFPDSSHRKEKAISEFKQKITEELSSCGRKKSEYKVYIQDFTNEDALCGGTEALVVDDEKMTYWEVCYGNMTDDGTEKLEVCIRGGWITYDWSDDLDRARAEKTMELSICDFSVVVP